jgi:drug/metabolite transporter (DMT)-like permease
LHSAGADPRFRFSDRRAPDNTEGPPEKDIPVTRRPATLIGLSAILMWSLLGLMTARSGQVPPFLMNALTFGVSGVGATLWLALTGRLGLLIQPLPVWLLGAGGLFGYHAFYFTAMRNAPPVEANLVNYLWPLLIVLFSGLLPGERLRAHHIIGALLGFAGAAVIVTKGRGIAVAPEHAFGLMSAAGAAVTWAVYSVASRRFGSVPTAAVAGFCLATAVFSGLCHLMLETTVLPATSGQWLAIAALGALPLGAAFFVWDIGVKRGDIQVLGAASYLAPLLSTGFLVADGQASLTWPIALAAILMTTGALIASKDMLIRRRASATGAEA